MAKNNEKELAYRYDLFITPDWRDRFDTLINENIEMPTEGRLLDINSGTGAHALELAERMRGKGEVIAVDPSAERVELARAKAQVQKINDVTFEQGGTPPLRFADREFDGVIGDASLLHARVIPALLGEMLRVAEVDAPVVLKLATRGSFDEFFSIFWEALHDEGLDEQVWARLEALINERPTVSDAEALAERAGLRDMQSFSSKAEFAFESGEAFLDSPLIKDTFLDEWLAIIPAERRQEVSRRIVAIIDRERNEMDFDVSIKATLIAGRK
ncbi:MAG TPA: class I SAM-dependent methyltransferase [Blastocatellia bacterium]|nr:class I SAM-dependent methyltransferase [Blastocatellia bacterium]